MKVPPIPYANSDKQKEWFDANLKLVDTGGCQIQSCSLKNKDCSAQYSGILLSLSETKVYGVQNSKVGWSEEACLECVDPTGSII